MNPFMKLTLTDVRIGGAITDFVYSFVSPDEIKAIMLLALGVSIGMLLLMIFTGSWNKKIAANLKLGHLGIGLFLLILLPTIMSLAAGGMDTVFTAQ